MMRSVLKYLRPIGERSLSTSSSEPAIDPVTYDKRENVTLIGLNRPHCKNAMNSIMAQQLNIVMKSFEEDHSSNVAILHGNGTDFCSGYDLKEASEGGLSEETKEVLKQHGPMGITREAFKKPVIAALNGYVIGGGLELALACDLRIATSDTLLGGFNRKHGVPFIDGCTVRLPALIGLSRALDLILTGRPVDVNEAYSMGLVNRITDDNDLITEAFKLAKQISDDPQFCMLTDRHNAYYSTYNAKSLQDALNHEFENGWKVVNVESIKGAKKFINRKR